MTLCGINYKTMYIYIYISDNPKTSWNSTLKQTNIKTFHSNEQTEMGSKIIFITTSTLKFHQLLIDIDQRLFEVSTSSSTSKQGRNKNLELGGGFATSRVQWLWLPTLLLLSHWGLFFFFDVCDVG